VSSAIKLQESSSIASPSNAENAPPEPSTMPPARAAIVLAAPQDPSTPSPTLANAREENNGSTTTANAQTTSHSGTVKSVLPAQLEPLSSQKISNVTTAQKDLLSTPLLTIVNQDFENGNDFDSMLFL